MRKTCRFYYVEKWVDQTPTLFGYAVVHGIYAKGNSNDFVFNFLYMNTILLIAGYEDIVCMKKLNDVINSASVSDATLVALWHGISCGNTYCIIHYAYNNKFAKIKLDEFRVQYVLDNIKTFDIESMQQLYSTFVNDSGKLSSSKYTIFSPVSNQNL